MRMHHIRMVNAHICMCLHQSDWLCIFILCTQQLCLGSLGLGRRLLASFLISYSYHSPCQPGQNPAQGVEVVWGNGFRCAVSHCNYIINTVSFRKYHPPPPKRNHSRVGGVEVAERWYKKLADEVSTYSWVFEVLHKELQEVAVLCTGHPVNQPLMLWIGREGQRNHIMHAFEFIIIITSTVHQTLHLSDGHLDNNEW